MTSNVGFLDPSKLWWHDDQRFGSKEPNRILIGVAYHPSFQQVAFLNQDTGECGELCLNHSDGEAERFWVSFLHQPEQKLRILAVDLLLLLDSFGFDLRWILIHSSISSSANSRSNQRKYPVAYTHTDPSLLQVSIATPGEGFEVDARRPRTYSFAPS